MTRRKFVTAAAATGAVGKLLAGIKLDPFIKAPIPRTINGTFYPVVYNGDFEIDGTEVENGETEIYPGMDGWEIASQYKDTPEPFVTEDWGGGKGLFFHFPGMVYTSLNVDPTKENEIIFYCRCTHGSKRRTFSVIWIGDDKQRIDASLYTPWNWNEYSNDGWGLETFTFNPTAKRGRLFIGGDCLKFRIVYFGGRYMY